MASYSRQEAMRIHAYKDGKVWWAYALDKEGNQFGSAEYGRNKRQAIYWLKKRMGLISNEPMQEIEEKYKFCGYSNCFRPFYKMRGFMPCCEFHYKNPKKWGDDGKTYTGSVFHKRDGKEE